MSANDSKTTSGDAPEPSPCTACRGIGTVVSSLGGEPSTVSCPWCEGTGVFIADHDAQGHWESQGGTDVPAPVAEPPAPDAGA